MQFSLKCIHNTHVLLVKLPLVLLPQRKEPVHVSIKNMVVSAFEQVNKLMYNDIRQAFRGFFGKLKVYPDAAGLLVTGPPFCFHSFYLSFGSTDSNDLLPVPGNIRQDFCKPGTIPFLHYGAAFFECSAGPHA